MEKLRTNELQIRSGLWNNDVFVVSFASRAAHGLAGVRNGREFGPLTPNWPSFQPGFQDGPLDVARFNEPSGLCQGLANSILVADKANHMIRRVLNGRVDTILGNGTSEHRDGPAASARLAYPHLIASTESHVVIAQEGSSSIRVFACKTGVLHTLDLKLGIPSSGTWLTTSLVHLRLREFAITSQDGSYILTLDDDSAGTPVPTTKPLAAIHGVKHYSASAGPQDSLVFTLGSNVASVSADGSFNMMPQLTVPRHLSEPSDKISIFVSPNGTYAALIDTYGSIYFAPMSDAGRRMSVGPSPGLSTALQGTSISGPPGQHMHTNPPPSNLAGTNPYPSPSSASSTNVLPPQQGPSGFPPGQGPQQMPQGYPSQQQQQQQQQQRLSFPPQQQPPPGGLPQQTQGRPFNAPGGNMNQGPPPNAFGTNPSTNPFMTNPPPTSQQPWPPSAIATQQPPPQQLPQQMPQQMPRQLPQQMPQQMPPQMPQPMPAFGTGPPPQQQQLLVQQQPPPQMATQYVQQQTVVQQQVPQQQVVFAQQGPLPAHSPYKAQQQVVVTTSSRKPPVGGFLYSDSGLWEWEKAHDDWEPYSVSVSSSIDAAARSGLPKATFMLGSAQYEIDLTSQILRQRPSSDLSKSRRVRPPRTFIYR